jgi:aarF domain-containing kinase
VVYGATHNDADRILDYSLKLGFLTGEENKQMLESHSKSAMFIGEPFKHEGPFFDFGNSDISRRLMNEIPVMLKNRLSPPPQEVYSLHRKLSGAYFIWIKLKSRVNSRDMFKEASDRFIKANKMTM